MNRAAISLLAVLLLQAALFAREGAIKEETEVQTLQFLPRGSVVVRNTDGRIFLYGSEGSEIKIEAVKRAFSQERLDAIKIDARVEGDIAIIDTFYAPAPEGMGADRSGTVDYRIYVPQDNSIALAELQNGEILLDGIRGDSAQARVVNGRLTARNCFTELTVSVGRGGMDVFYMWWEDEKFSLLANIDNGSVRLAVAPDAAGTFDLATGQGHVRSQFDKKGAGDQNARERKITLGEEENTDIELKVRAGTGNVRLERSY
jgi:hypothetical protein